MSWPTAPELYIPKSTEKQPRRLSVNTDIITQSGIRRICSIQKMLLNLHYMIEMQKNRFRTDLWKNDSIKSVDLYNQWFMTSAPEAYRKARAGVINKVVSAIKELDNYRSINSEKLLVNPEFVSVLRASTAPPLAIDRLAGLSHTTCNFVRAFERGKIPRKLSRENVEEQINRIISIISKLLDYEIFPWLNSSMVPTSQMINRSASIVADRISGALANPIIRNSQEARQLQVIDDYLFKNGYKRIKSSEIQSIETIPPLSYAHHLNVPVDINGRRINMPIDVVIQPDYSTDSHFPILIECKSAGDFANTNKRRKEEAIKVNQLRHTYGDDKITFILFLCGYFDTTYLGYEASENIDWVWEHRVSDFSEFGI